MAVNNRTRVLVKARGLPRPMQKAETPSQSLQDSSSSTRGVKRSLKQIEGGFSICEEICEESQSPPPKRQQLEAQTSTSSRHHGKSHLTSLPNELLFEIIEELNNPVDFACLASTCQQAYTTVRQNHSENLQLNKYQKIKFELRERLTDLNPNICSAQSKLWRRAYNELDLDFPYSDFVLSWCDVWHVTHQNLPVSELVPRSIVQHIRMDSKEQKLKWEEDWQAQLTSDRHILLHCTRTYPKVRFSNGQIMVNGALRDDGLFKMCNHSPTSDHGAGQDDEKIWSHLSACNIYALSCTMCNTNLEMEKVEGSTVDGVTAWDLKVRTFHSLGRFEIEECDSSSWLEWLGRQPSDDKQIASLHAEGDDIMMARKHCSSGAWSAWKTTLRESGLKEEDEKKKEKTKTLV